MSICSVLEPRPSGQWRNCKITYFFISYNLEVWLLPFDTLVPSEPPYFLGRVEDLQSGECWRLKQLAFIRCSFICDWQTESLFVFFNFCIAVNFLEFKEKWEHKLLNAASLQFAERKLESNKTAISKSELLWNLEVSFTLGPFTFN